MKKGLFLVTVMASNLVLAQQEQGNSAEGKASPPMLKLAVYDFSGSTPKDIGLKYSRKNPNLQLCWTAFNMPFAPDNKNEVFQQFISPSSKAAYRGIDSENIQVSKDGKTTTIKHIVPAYQNQFIQQCWKYDKTDPLGKYKLTVRINDIQFETLELELIK